ncbi:MAG: L-seryl-tRNA(Sec) selenium transferase [Planctomycetes bacterium]|nr:L-seryl-tRNA(Sec) selenium transferase [Planctomycetota bacterium]
MAQTNELLRSLPSIAVLLEHNEVEEWLVGLPRSAVVEALRIAVDAARDAILAGDASDPIDPRDLLAHAENVLVDLGTPSLRRVINATGIVLHTGLGRAPLCDAAIEAIAEGAAGYCNLEYELDTGSRGSRIAHVSAEIAKLTGAEAGTVVNNNAAATLLILHALADGRETVVSRGHLIEIGGSYRLPDVMRAGGTILTEVGTTNRTRISDYERAINDRTAVLLNVHTSNYRIVGFTEETGIAAIAELAHHYNLLAVDDLGSGAMFDLTTLGLPDEPSVRASIAAGADLVCFSGDKLLGGPQCGIIAGRRECIERLHADPLMRTYRVGKMTLLALEATLRHYRDQNDAVEHIPALAMLAATTEELAGRAGALCEQLQAAMPDEHFFVCSDVAFAGGGAMPARELPTVVIQWRPARMSTESATSALRHADVPVIARVRDDAVCLDLRTIRRDDEEDLVESVASVGVADADEGDDGDTSLPVL